jgi:predicted PurR-regulated permease PerM
MNQSTEPSDSYNKRGFWLMAAVILALTAYLFLPFLSAIMWAAVFSVLMYPVYARLVKRRSPTMSAAISVMATLGVVVLPLCVFGFILFVQVSSTLREMNLSAPTGHRVSSSDLLQKADELVAPVLSKLGSDFKIQPWFEENRKQIGQSISGPLARLAGSAGTTALNFVIALMTMFFMLRDGHRLRDPVLELVPLPREETEGLMERIVNTIRAVFVGVVLVSLIQGTLCGLAYALLGVPSPILWGIVTIISCMIPLLGAPIIYVPVSLFLFANGHWVQAVILLGIGFGIVSNIDNFLRPLFIGSKTNLPYMAIFFSLLGGVFAFGPVGIMAGPVIMTLMLSIIEIVRKTRPPEAEAPSP